MDITIKNINIEMREKFLANFGVENEAQLETKIKNDLISQYEAEQKIKQFQDKEIEVNNIINSEVQKLKEL